MTGRAAEGAPERTLDRTTTVAEVVREDWGRLLALLVARFGRIDLAEDALADAVEAAVRTWPRDGVPRSPAAWLLTAARRRAVDRVRTEQVAARAQPLLVVDAGVAAQAQRVMADAGEVVVDERLRLVLLCAHPRLSREAAAALSLRLVLGVPTAEVARLFLVPVPTMAARLTRARRKLAGAHFEVPSGAALTDRVAVVADVAYLAFTAAYAPGAGTDVLRSDAAAEAVRLVRVLREVVPRGVPAAELDALLALMLLQRARRDARVVDGRLVLLPDQDRARWRNDEVAEALDLLTPHVGAPPAPYLLQALVAAEHAIAPTPAATAWHRIVQRYDELLALGDSPVVRLNRAVALAEVEGPAAGLEALRSVALPGHRLPAARAELLARVGDAAAARTEYDQALALCRNEAEAAHLRERRARVG